MSLLQKMGGQRHGRKELIVCHAVVGQLAYNGFLDSRKMQPAAGVARFGRPYGTKTCAGFPPYVATRSSKADAAIGFEIYSSIPASRHRSRSPAKA